MSGQSEFALWIASTPLSTAIADHSWVIPTVQSIHICAIAAVLTSMAMLHLRLAGLIGRDQSVRLTARRFFPWVWGALPILLVTGAIMIIGEPERELESSYFWYKMTILVVVILLTIPLQHLLEDRPFRDLPPAKRQIVRLLALLSLLLWFAIIFCGRWIAYE